MTSCDVPLVDLRSVIVLYSLEFIDSNMAALLHCDQISMCNDRSKAVLLLWILFCYVCFTFVFVILSCLVLAAL